MDFCLTWAGTEGLIALLEGGAHIDSNNREMIVANLKQLPRPLPAEKYHPSLILNLGFILIKKTNLSPVNIAETAFNTLGTYYLDSLNRLGMSSPQLPEGFFVYLSSRLWIKYSDSSGNHPKHKDKPDDSGLLRCYDQAYYQGSINNASIITAFTPMSLQTFQLASYKKDFVPIAQALEQSGLTPSNHFVKKTSFDPFTSAWEPSIEFVNEVLLELNTNGIAMTHTSNPSSTACILQNIKREASPTADEKVETTTSVNYDQKSLVQKMKSLTPAKQQYVLSQAFLLLAEKQASAKEKKDFYKKAIVHCHNAKTLEYNPQKIKELGNKLKQGYRFCP